MNATTDELIREFVAQGGRAEDWRPACSIAPTETAPIIREWSDRAGELLREVTLARWDWQKPPRMPQNRPIFNARIEKLSGSWAAPFSSSRCIVPMRGYYEWTGDKVKTPHFIHGNGLLAAAGLTWHMPVGEDTVSCFVVITREARDASGEVHDRMPAFLPRELCGTTGSTPPSWTMTGELIEAPFGVGDQDDDEDALDAAAKLKNKRGDRGEHPEQQ